MNAHIFRKQSNFYIYVVFLEWNLQKTENWSTVPTIKNDCKNKNLIKLHKIQFV